MSALRNSILFLVALSLSGCSLLTSGQPQSHRPLEILGTLPAQHAQALLVIADDIRPGRASISAWEREDGEWMEKFSPMSAVLGRNGLAASGEKREGDGRTPAGIYQIKRAFGYAPRVDTRLDYRQATANDFWVDDPASAQYNQWVTGAPPAVSHEILRRDDRLYQYAVVIEYNTAPVVPGRGSAIFLHVWRGKGIPTAGCVAVSPKNMQKFLKWLDLPRNPVIILSDDQD